MQKIQSANYIDMLISFVKDISLGGDPVMQKDTFIYPCLFVSNNDPSLFEKILSIFNMNKSRMNDYFENIDIGSAVAMGSRIRSEFYKSSKEFYEDNPDSLKSFLDKGAIDTFNAISTANSDISSVNSYKLDDIKRLFTGNSKDEYIRLFLSGAVSIDQRIILKDSCEDIYTFAVNKKMLETLKSEVSHVFKPKIPSAPPLAAVTPEEVRKANLNAEQYIPNDAQSSLIDWNNFPRAGETYFTPEASTEINQALLDELLNNARFISDLSSGVIFIADESGNQINGNFRKEGFGEYQLVNKDLSSIQLGGMVAYVFAGENYQKRTEMYLKSQLHQHALPLGDGDTTEQSQVKYPPSYSQQGGNAQHNGRQYLQSNQMSFVTGEVAQHNHTFTVKYQVGRRNERIQSMRYTLRQQIKLLKGAIFAIPTKKENNLSMKYDDAVKVLQDSLDKLCVEQTINDKTTKLYNVESRKISASLSVSELPLLVEMVKENPHIEELEINLHDYQENPEKANVLKQLQGLICKLPNISKVECKRVTIPILQQEIAQSVTRMKQMTPIGINLHGIDQKLLSVKHCYISTFINVVKEKLSDTSHDNQAECIRKMANKFAGNQEDLNEQEQEIYTALFSQMSCLQHEISKDLTTDQLELHKVLVKQCADELLSSVLTLFSINKGEISKEEIKINKCFCGNISNIKKAACLSVLMQFPGFQTFAHEKILITNFISDSLIGQLTSPTLEGMLEGDTMSIFEKLIKDFHGQEASKALDGFQYFEALYKVIMVSDAKKGGDDRRGRLCSGHFNPGQGPGTRFTEGDAQFGGYVVRD